MGYTHYWRRAKEIDSKTFAKIVVDFNRILPRINEVICLAGPLGKGAPVINDSEISFNGAENCGHPKNSQIVIPWPSRDAGGIANPLEDVHSGNWFAGAQVSKRCCDGNCSYESFVFERVRKLHGNWDKPAGEKYFDFCKTAFRPYDLAVIAFLLIAKHHLNNRIIVSSDGEDQHWFDGKLLCQTELGYGLEMELGQDGNLEEVNPAKTKAS